MRVPPECCEPGVNSGTLSSCASSVRAGDEPGRLRPPLRCRYSASARASRCKTSGHVRSWHHCGTHRAGTPVNWLDELREFQSCVDWPGCWQWQQLAELWPKAQVLLTLRDAQSWYDSALGSIHEWTKPGQDVGPPEVAELLEAIWDQHFGGWAGFFDRERAIAAYNAHIEDVRRQCPVHRLIEWQVADGWRPLCEAFDIPIPDVPVPHLNARDPA